MNSKRPTALLHPSLLPHPRRWLAKHGRERTLLWRCLKGRPAYKSSTLRHRLRELLRHDVIGPKLERVSEVAGERLPAELPRKVAGYCIVLYTWGFATWRAGQARAGLGRLERGCGW